ncbi:MULTISPECIES: CaiB/BaiF CoA-transferase family protein [unclassified Burkholderia]|uniref:CaiB/BaiF CoA transferase family protein n=1 Tax=unclassified Burkholderia TaxID=2613784 RepID=UPI000F5A1842|nr:MULTISPECIES: CoA transferase [unclassified Burkholderia]RQS19123.1 CoA transferase [Burkholderia sp. Bp8995]RQS38884.1 CoA transferase [Burkholderia sp. Bp8989]
MSNEFRQQGSPLAGVKVLELGSLIAGPYACALLAQFGAEVIKVEPPGIGDPLRKWRKLHDGTSLWWYTQSRNKKSLTLDLKTAEGRDVIKRLAQEVDIVIENFRPGTLERWGIGWEQLSELNPKLIMVRISGYGQTGPLAQRPGFAAIAECMGGLRHTSGFPDRPPVRVGVSLGDTLASLYGAIGALLAMHHLNVNGGTGQFIDVALYESVFAIMESLIPEFSVQGHVRERTGASLPGISPSNTYLCGDGNYIIIAGNGDAIFRRLMSAIGRLDLSEDPALAQNDGRVKNNEMLDAAISAWTRERTLEEALDILEKAEVPSGRIYTAADILQDPQYNARSMIEQHVLPDGVPVHLPGVVPKLSATPGGTKWLGPKLGQHTDEVLGSLGFASGDIAQLREKGIV